MSQQVVAKEQAELEFTNFAEAMDIDIDIEDMDQDDLKSFYALKKRIIKSIMNGSLTFTDNNEPIFTPQRESSGDKTPITFYEPKGSVLLSMDKMGKNKDVNKMFGLMGEMSKTSASRFSKLAMPDFNVCQGIVTLFLG